MMNNYLKKREEGLKKDVSRFKQITSSINQNVLLNMKKASVRAKVEVARNKENSQQST